MLPFLEIGGDLPVTFAQGDNFEAIAGGFPPFNTGVSGGLGDLRLVPRLFTPASWKLPVDVAIVPELRFPTGSAESFLGGNGVIFAPRANIEHAFGAVRLLLNVGLRYRSTGRFINLIVENEFTGGGAVVWTLPSGSVFRRPELIAETTFSTPLSQPFAANVGSNSASATTPWEFLVGARTLFGKHWGATLAVGRGIASDAGYGREGSGCSPGSATRSSPSPPRPRSGTATTTASLTSDRCLDEPGDGPDGCPDLDWDKDGIPNVDDRCPREPAPASSITSDRDQTASPTPRTSAPTSPARRRTTAARSRGRWSPSSRIGSGSTAASTSTPTRRSSSPSPSRCSTRWSGYWPRTRS